MKPHTLMCGSVGAGGSGDVGEKIFYLSAKACKRVKSGTYKRLKTGNSRLAEAARVNGERDWARDSRSDHWLNVS